jgi:hypothetical protein
MIVNNVKQHWCQYPRGDGKKQAGRTPKMDSIFQAEIKKLSFAYPSNERGLNAFSGISSK